MSDLPTGLSRFEESVLSYFYECRGRGQEEVTAQGIASGRSISRQHATAICRTLAQRSLVTARRLPKLTYWRLVAVDSAVTPERKDGPG